MFDFSSWPKEIDPKCVFEARKISGYVYEYLIDKNDEEKDSIYLNMIARRPLDGKEENMHIYLPAYALGEMANMFLRMKVDYENQKSAKKRNGEKMSYFGVTVEGIPSVDRVLDVMAKAGKQLPFAISLAVNKTAEALRVFEVEKQIPSKLTVRNNWPVSGPYKVKKTFATKSNPSAIVGSEAWFLEGVERGKEKTPKGKTVLVPEMDIRQTQNRLIAKQMTPAVLLSKKKAFFLPSASGPVLFMRTGKGKRDLKALFFGKPRTHINPKLDFESAGEEYVLKIYPKMFGDALGQALATAK